MTEERKKLYRELLYWAMIDMRSHAPGNSHFWNWRRQARILTFISAITNWLHNVAHFSSFDFEGFEEEPFWQEYQRFRREFPPSNWAPFTETVIVELQKLV
ncbi:hypothetical protein [Hymenobacter rubidus]|uniref:hypothetical protein n=1 Tax=Hymenobacter rubidus TaxID=1441626 RepID=UPI00191C9F5B|nr:hypothetical protein [Hymenobacter rubidus]